MFASEDEPLINPQWETVEEGAREVGHGRRAVGQGEGRDGEWPVSLLLHQPTADLLRQLERHGLQKLGEMELPVRVNACMGGGEGGGDWGGRGGLWGC
jgi:hypothetical protein